MRIKQSVVLPIFHGGQGSIDTLLGQIRDSGFAAVEIWGRPPLPEFKTLMAAVQKCGLRMAGMCGHASLGDGLNRVENHHRIATELSESIALAADYDIPGLICFSGNRNAGQSDYEGLLVCAQALRLCAPLAEAKGVNLNVELLNSRIDHYNYQADHTDWGVALCNLVNSPRVKLLYDIYHMQIMEGDVIRTLQKSIRHIGHFHTAGNPGRQDFDDNQELNYRGICRAIAQSGYDGYVGHEFRPRGDAMQALRRAFTVCDWREEAAG